MHVMVYQYALTVFAKIYDYTVIISSSSVYLGNTTQPRCKKIRKTQRDNVAYCTNVRCFALNLSDYQISVSVFFLLLLSF